MAAILGAALLLGSYVMLAALPAVTAFEVVRCLPHAPPPSNGSTVSCLSSVNLIYPLVFLVSIGGTVVLFVGIFGGRFVLSPLFVAGMVALEYGLAATASAILGGADGVSTNPLLFSPLVAVGSLALCVHAYRTLRKKTT